MADFRPLPPAFQWPRVTLVPSPHDPRILVPEDVLMAEVEDFMDEYAEDLSELAKL
jgi:hypothetical protein